MHIHGGNIYKNKVEADFSANLNLLGMPDRVREAAMKGVYQSEAYPDPDCTKLREKLAIQGLTNELLVEMQKLQRDVNDLEERTNDELERLGLNK